MRMAGSDHPISVKPFTRRLKVMVDDTVIADTRRALILKEATYPEVYYIPREDADMAQLSKTDRVTKCPHKGEAVYFTISGDVGRGDRLTNVVWSYEAPLPAVAEIAGHLAFYPNKVTISVG